MLVFMNKEGNGGGKREEGYSREEVNNIIPSSTEGEEREEGKGRGGGNHKGMGEKQNRKGE